MSTLRCVPGDGLGNSFLLLMEADAARTGLTWDELAVMLCTDEIGRQAGFDRACDGLLVVSPGQGDGPLRLSIVNRDGSAGGVCLNGLRMAALWTHQGEGAFAMDGHHIKWQLLSENVVELHLAAADLPQELRLQHVCADGRDGIKVPFWNPHAVFPVADVDAVDLAALAAATAEQTELFEQGVNVEVIAPAGDSGLKMRVFERGVGETSACASGAVAVALVAWAEGKPGELGILMQGGILVLSPSSEGGILVAGEGALGSPFEVSVS